MSAEMDDNDNSDTAISYIVIVRDMGRYCSLTSVAIQRVVCGPMGMKGEVS
jgi:hypothetical protein